MFYKTQNKLAEHIKRSIDERWVLLLHLCNRFFNIYYYSSFAFLKKQFMIIDVVWNDDGVLVGGDAARQCRCASRTFVASRRRSSHWRRQRSLWSTVISFRCFSFSNFKFLFFVLGCNNRFWLISLIRRVLLVSKLNEKRIVFIPLLHSCNSLPLYKIIMCHTKSYNNQKWIF